MDMSTVDADTVTELAQVITELSLLKAAGVHSAEVLQFLLVIKLLEVLGGVSSSRQIRQVFFVKF